MESIKLSSNKQGESGKGVGIKMKVSSPPSPKILPSTSPGPVSIKFGQKVGNSKDLGWDELDSNERYNTDIHIHDHVEGLGLVSYSILRRFIRAKYCLPESDSDFGQFIDKLLDRYYHEKHHPELESFYRLGYNLSIILDCQAYQGLLYRGRPRYMIFRCKKCWVCNTIAGEQAAALKNIPSHKTHDHFAFSLLPVKNKMFFHHLLYEEDSPYVTYLKSYLTNVRSAIREGLNPYLKLPDSAMIIGCHLLNRGFKVSPHFHGVLSIRKGCRLSMSERKLNKLLTKSISKGLHAFYKESLSNAPTRHRKAFSLKECQGWLNRNPDAIDIKQPDKQDLAKYMKYTLRQVNYFRDLRFKVEIEKHRASSTDLKYGKVVIYKRGSVLGSLSVLEFALLMILARFPFRARKYLAYGGYFRNRKQTSLASIP